MDGKAAAAKVVGNKDGRKLKLFLGYKSLINGSVVESSCRWIGYCSRRTEQEGMRKRGLDFA